MDVLAATDRAALIPSPAAAPSAAPSASSGEWPAATGARPRSVDLVLGHDGIDPLHPSGRPGEEAIDALRDMVRLGNSRVRSLDFQDQIRTIQNQSMGVQHVAAQQNVRLALAERRSNGDRRQIMHADFYQEDRQLQHFTGKAETITSRPRPGRAP
jgi:hypothetical protein